MSLARLFAWLFLLFCAANAFVFWAAPLWMPVMSFFEPPTLIGPRGDALIAPVATVLVALQLPSGLVIDQLEKVYRFGTIDALISISALSAACYALPIVGLRSLLHGRG